MSRHLNTSIGEIEEWDIDTFMAYRASLGRVLKAEAPPRRSGRRK